MVNLTNTHLRLKTLPHTTRTLYLRWVLIDFTKPNLCFKYILNSCFSSSTDGVWTYEDSSIAVKVGPQGQPRPLKLWRA